MLSAIATLTPPSIPLSPTPAPTPSLTASPERLFATYFLPLYPPELRADARALDAQRRADENPGCNPSLPAHLADAAGVFVANASALFGPEAARALALDGSDASVHRLSAALTPERFDTWAAQGAAGTAENVLFNAVVHGAAYVGRCVVDNHGGAWGIRRPLWESVVRLSSRAGEADLPVFHWWLKSLSGEPSTTLADRYRAYVEVPCTPPEAYPVLTTHERALPRLKAPTYDRLYKYMRAHLPEIRGLGSDFPTAERFAAYELRWIDAHFLGGARMVLLAGASPNGMHLFWLGAGGFEKAAFIAGDAFPDPVVKVRDDRIVVMTSLAGESQTSEMLWWGP